MTFMQSHPLGLAGRVLDDLDRASLDDEEFVLTISGLEQMLPVAQYPPRAEFAQRGHMDVVERRERDFVHVQIGHGCELLQQQGASYRKDRATGAGTSSCI